ncbi:MAG: N-acetyltransferase [Acidimicrobiales bacterium]
MQFRRANAQDIDAIALLHAESWRNSYRGAYSDAFLDGDVFDDRRAVWSERLARPSARDETVVAEWRGSIIGFVHTILDHDPLLGALLDNLHVAHDVKRTGIGTQLMAQSASAVMARATNKRLYLAVLEANAPAQAFYEARGGERVGQEISEAPGGGSVVGFLYAWKDPSVLLPAP